MNICYVFHFRFCSITKQIQFNFYFVSTLRIWFWKKIYNDVLFMNQAIKRITIVFSFHHNLSLSYHNFKLTKPSSNQFGAQHLKKISLYFGYSYVVTDFKFMTFVVVFSIYELYITSVGFILIFLRYMSLYLLSISSVL